MENEVARSLEDGPDYAPDWRAQTVHHYLADIATAQDGAARLAEILDAERDPFVRQFLRFRYNGKSVNADAFKYALGCQARNRTTNAASMIRAMLVADRTPEEIAAELGTTRFNIVTFAKLFFDVRRYLNNESWLLRVVTAGPPEGTGEAEALREKRWLSAAYHRGWAGVEQVIFHRTPSDSKDVESLSQQLLASLGARALEFVEELQSNGTPPTEADLRRFLTARNAQSRQPPAPSDDSGLMTAFMRGIHGVLEKKSEESDDPALAIFREMKAANTGDSGAAPQRLRRRFAGA
ncbi:MAG: hypothetical protein ABIP85_22205 [Chthoniobacteraceae bacterium]